VAYESLGLVQPDRVVARHGLGWRLIATLEAGIRV
jgi:hypothetical protein